MKDVTLKPTTLRMARAEARVTLPAAALALIREKRTDKGDVLEAARIAALFAFKKTPEWLPHCHPIAVLDAGVEFRFEADALVIETQVRTIAPTGVEMEALTGASAAALTVYDMLKPHVAHDAMAIASVRLLEKTGGKSQFHRAVRSARAAVIVLSDTVAKGRKPDTAGLSVKHALSEAGFSVEGYEVLPDDPAQLAPRLQEWLKQKMDLLVTVGGTGLGPRDQTVETVRPLLTTEIPGLMEAARGFGQARTPYAMLSRGIAGFAGGTLVITFPGSRRGAEETVAALLPGLVHLLEVQRATRPHSGGYT